MRWVEHKAGCSLSELVLTRGEDAVTALGYRSVTIARPSLLLGPRKERRRGEEMAKRFGWLMPPKYKPVEAAAVARALVEEARRIAVRARSMTAGYRARTSRMFRYCPVTAVSSVRPCGTSGAGQLSCGSSYANASAA